MALLLGAVGQRDDGVAVVLARRHRLLVLYVAVLVVPLKEGNGDFRLALEVGSQLRSWV